jgi:hypothetical protein
MSSSSSSHKRARYVRFVIGNTFHELPEDEWITRPCPDGQTRRYRYDWHLYLDVVVVEGAGGDDDDPRGIIARVEVDMGPTFLFRRHYVQNRPRRMTHGVVLRQQDDDDDDRRGRRWRCFDSRQRCWGRPGTVRFRIVGMSGNDLKIRYDGSEVMEGFFCDEPAGGTEGPPRWKPIPLPAHVGFSCQVVMPHRDDDDGGGSPCQQPLAEVIPLLHGEDGLQGMVSDVHQTTHPTHTVAGVVISVTIDHSLEAARKVALNFIKYEQAMDEMLSSRTRPKTHGGGGPSPDDTPFAMVVGDGSRPPGAKSNRAAVPGTTNKEKHDTLIACETLDDLVKALTTNPDDTTIDDDDEGTRYKLAMTEHAGKLTVRLYFPNVPVHDATLVEHWIRFSVLLVHNSCRFRRPQSFKPGGRSLVEQIDFLFEHVIRDRVVEEALVIRDDEDKDDKDDNVLLQDADTNTVMNMSECMDGLSFIESVAVPQGGGYNNNNNKNNIPLGVFDDSLLDPDAQGVTRKRPRGGTVAEDGFITVPSAHMGLEPICGHELRHDTRLFTASQLSRILKRLSMTVGNQKAQRMGSLKRYFQARSTELAELHEKNSPLWDRKGAANEGVLGIEMALEQEATRNDITMYLRGGKKASRLRISVDISKSDDLVLEDVPAAELEGICAQLGIPAGVSHLDAYMNGVATRGFMHTQVDNAGCCFVLVQNFVVKS